LRRRSRTDFGIGVRTTTSKIDFSKSDHAAKCKVVAALDEIDARAGGGRVLGAITVFSPRLITRIPRVGRA
jgi:hypothetical protein